ncbi:NUDIX domain-containing protein [Candidatus Gottesmanbacteria bacterium]|nr:NUDIX domain-containing protein [Candidatus Gottesmanbacteria bacterium]
MNNPSGPTEKAGAIILNKVSTKVVLLYRGNHGDWSFPKGHIKSGENPGDAMIREIQEETGVTGKIIAPLPAMTYLNSEKAEVRLSMYLLRAETEQLVKEFDGDTLEWVDLDEVIAKLTHQNLKDYFLQQLPHICEIF